MINTHLVNITDGLTGNAVFVWHKEGCLWEGVIDVDEGSGHLYSFSF